MAAKKPRCTHWLDAEHGVCFKLATQRVLIPGRIIHRCADHAFTKTEAKRNKWQVFDLAAERQAS